MASDLEVFPISLPGGINQSAPEPTESDMEELLNFATFRNRLGLRAPISLIATVQDDQITPADVEAILDIAEHEGEVWIASWSSVTDKVYLHSMQSDGSSLTLKGVLWSSVTSKPTIRLVSFEGGDASTPTARLYACDYDQNLSTVYWDGDSVETTSQDLEATSSADPLVFSLMASHKFHLWGTGFFQQGVSRPEMIRFSQPGTIAGTDPAGGTNPREWFTADHRSLGRRGDKIVCISSVGDRLLLYQRRSTHVIFGSGALTWSTQQLSNVIGAVGPASAAAVDERLAYFWAADGPYRTDGSTVQYLGLPIRQLAIESDAAEKDTLVAYSPDDGLVYFIVSEGGEDSYSRALVFDHRRERWMRSEWLDIDGTPLEFGALTFLEAVAAPGPAGAPSLVTATATSDTTITVEWVNGDTNIDTRTHVYRSTSSGFTPNDATNRVAVVDGGVISYEDTGLTANTQYFYKLRHHRNAEHSSASNQATDTTWLAEPTSVGLAGLTSGLRITGTNNATGADIVIQRRTSGGSFATIETLSNPGASFSYDDTALTCGTTYFYRTRAEDTGATASEWSTEVSREACSASVAPGAPSGTTATASGESQINLTWTDNSDNEDGFEIHRSLNGTDYSLLTTKAANSTSHSDTNLDSNTQYWYKIRAVNAAGDSAFDTADSATTDANLDTPSDLSAVAVSISQIDLSWTDTAADETAWEIYQADDAIDGTYAHVKTLSAGDTIESITGLGSNHQYWFKVRPALGSTKGSFSNIATATTDTPAPDVPDAPTLLVATKNSGSPTDTIDLAWQDNATTEDLYEVWRDSGGGFVKIAEIASNSESYQDAGLTPGTAYTYKVRCVDNGGGGNSPYSNTDSATTDGIPTEPAAPDNLQGTASQTASDTGGRVALTWDDNSDNEDKFILEYCEGSSCSGWTVLAELPAGTENYEVTLNHDETSNTIYRFRIKASNSVGDSAYSSIESVTVPPQRTPTGMSSTNSSFCDGNEVPTPMLTVSWNQGDVTGLVQRRLQRVIGASESWTTIASSGFTTAYQDTDVDFGVGYRYRVIYDFGSDEYTSSPSLSSSPTSPECEGPL